MSYNTPNRSSFPAARRRGSSISEYSENDGGNTPNYPAATAKNEKAPILRERDVALSVGQAARRPSSASNGNEVNGVNGGGGATPVAPPPQQRGRRSSPVRGSRRPSAAPSRPMSVSRRGSAASYGVDVDALPSQSVSRRRGSVSGTVGHGSSSVPRRRSRAESPKPNFIVEPPQRQNSTNSKKKGERVDAKAVEQLWKGTLRAGDLDRTGDDAQDGGAAVDAQNESHRAHSMMSVYKKQQERRGPVEQPPTRLEKEIPYDYIRVAKTQRGPHRDPNTGPPIVIAVPIRKRTKKPKEVARQDEAPPAEVEYQLEDEPVCAVARSPTRTPVRQTSPQPNQQQARTVSPDMPAEDAYEQHEDACSEPSEAETNATTAAARRSAYQQWRERTASGLYKEVFYPPMNCEVKEIPPFFEPSLRDDEANLVNESAHDNAVLNGYEERILRYRLATQQNAKKTSVEDVQLSATSAQTIVPVVRAVRYRHEEQNWQEAIATIERNESRVAEREAQAAQQQRDYEEAVAQHAQHVAEYEERRRAAKKRSGQSRGASTVTALGVRPRDGVIDNRQERDVKGSSPRSTSQLSPRPRTSSPGPGVGMGSAKINSATTPGWMRHREFSGNEWDALQGKRGTPAGRANRDSGSAVGSLRAEGSFLSASLGPRNPNQPAWMHHLSAAQAAEEAADPQQQKLNEIETQSSVARVRGTAPATYSLGQSQRMRSNSDFVSEDSLNFGRGADLTSPAHLLVARPTRVDITAQHDDVVENTVPRDQGEEFAETHVRNGFSAGVEMDELSRPREQDPSFLIAAAEEEEEEEEMTRAPEAPKEPEPLPPARLERLIFTVYPFSTFEVTQELKRITWWCAAHQVDAFTVRLGETEGNGARVRSSRRRAQNKADGAKRPPQSRSYSPTFFPGTARFYDETLVTVHNDLWLRKRVTVAAHDADSGEVDFDITPATLDEAARENWLNLEKLDAAADDEDKLESMANDGGNPLSDDDDDVISQELYPTAAENHTDLNSTAPPPPIPPPRDLLHTARPTGAGSDEKGGTQPPPPAPRAAPSRPTTEELRFFTDRPHPKSAPAFM